MVGKNIILGALCSALAAAATIPSGFTVDQVVSRMVQVDEQKRANLPEYSVTRKYILRNSHMKRDADMVVKVSYSKAEGKTFQVLESIGVEGLTKRVFQHLLDAEKDAARQNRGRINTQNYKFDLVGSEIIEGRPCYVLALTPRAKTKDLFIGKIWVDSDEFAITKLEGTPAASLSFWAGKPFISQTWHKTGDFWMAAHNRSRSESMLLGSSELTIENRNYQFSPAVQTDSHGPTTTVDPAVASLPSSHRSDR